MRNVADKICREKQNTHFTSVNPRPPPPTENRAVHEIMWTDIVKSGRPQMATWRMLLSCWITKATNPLRICNTYCSSTATIVAMDESQFYFIRILLVLFVCLCDLYGIS